jgi:hypothetical protein
MFELPKDGSAIAVELGITRQAVSNLLKRGMTKFYKETRKLDKGWGPFDCSCAMLRMLNVGNTEAEIKKFYQLFPPSIRKEIEKDALENHCSKKYREEYEEE